MCKATLEMFWDDGASRYDNLDDRMAVSGARISALAGGHAIATLSDGYQVEYLSDDCNPKGYRTKVGWTNENFYRTLD